MILDHLDNADCYNALDDRFARAFEFLRRKDLAELEPGRHDIDGDNLYALIARDAGKGRGRARLEAHRKYIDIQFCLAGVEEIGWRPVCLCAPDADGYNAGKDIGFFTDRPLSWLAVPAGSFAVFLPTDAHAPLAGTGPMHKVVVKVLGQ